MGYLNPGASGGGYIAGMKLSVGKVPVAGLDPGAARIVAYDRASKSDAYLGQLNVEAASSFCGVGGALWGYHLATASEIKTGVLEPMFVYPGPGYPPAERLPAQGPVPVYPLAPLLDATERLFGRVDREGSGEVDLRRFAPMPGAHVPCATKGASSAGPGYVWIALGIAIAEDRDAQASLFIEDADVIPAVQAQGALGTDWAPSPAEVRDQLFQHLRSVAKSMVLCGQNQDVVYTKIFVGAKFIFVDQDEWGGSLAFAPYITLARDAVPSEQGASELISMSIIDWERRLGLDPLPPPPVSAAVGGIGVGEPPSAGA